MNQTLPTMHFRKHRKKLLRIYLVNKKMCKGLSNFQIEKTPKDINDPDKNDSFAGVFPAYRSNRFMDYKTMISEKKGNIHLS